MALDSQSAGPSLLLMQCADKYGSEQSHLSFVVRRTRLSTISDQAFPVAASQLWNTATERHVGAVTDCF